MIALRFSHAYPGFALDAELELPARGVTVLFGASGSGKTTCLRCIAGLERARGFLAIDGEVWQDDDRQRFVPTHRRPLSMVFQDAALFPHLSVRQNLDYGRRRTTLGRMRLESSPVVELLGIGHLLERMPGALSGGEQQRVAIARALLTEPRLLLMDEPLAALDERRKAEFLPYLERLHDELKIPVIYVSHSPLELARLADHVVLLDDGRVLASGPLAEILPRLDLPLAQDEEAGVVIEATVGELDPDYALTRLDFAGRSLWTTGADKAPGSAVRLRVLARDVSLTLSQARDSSILNVIPARIEALQDGGPGRLLVRLDVGGATLLARITRKSAALLGTRVGQEVFAQIKGVAFLK